jgi:hypothetical protein
MTPYFNSLNFKRFFLGITLLTISSTCAVQTWATEKKTIIYQFDISKVEGHKPLKLVVEPQGNSIVISYYNEFGDREVSIFAQNYRTLYAQYFDPQNRETAHVTYDYNKKLITLIGIHDAVYPLEVQAFENTGSLFHLFGVLYPLPEKDLVFSMTQGNLSRIQSTFQRLLICKLVGPLEMFLKCKGDETITLEGKTRLARHFELGIRDKRFVMFWPAIYHFWYSSEAPHIMLKYEGKNPKGETEIITFISKRELEPPVEKLKSSTRRSTPIPASVRPEDETNAGDNDNDNSDFKKPYYQTLDKQNSEEE